MSSDDAWKAEIWTKGFHQVAQFLFFLQRMLQNFQKKRMENATVSSAGTFWRGIRAEKTQKHRLPPSSDETQALFGSSSDQTLEALLERTAGREGLAVLP